jgi:uncharacterized protein (TIGR03032 family)
MSTVGSAARPESSGSSAPSEPRAAPAPVPFHYVQSESFVSLLSELGASLLVSTYQANKMLVARATNAGLSTLVRTFDQPMGFAVDAKRLTIGTRKEVWELRNAPDIAPRIEPIGHHDACYLPRSCHVTGDIRVHELAWARFSEQNDTNPTRERGNVADQCAADADMDLWCVNTRFSCLCTLHPNYSFVPRWRPPFITALAAEDRCHLNGMAVVDGSLKYVTALGETDTAGGWREGKARGGCLMHVPSGQVVTRGLSMPHSPRWHDNRLWVLESGTGSLAVVDPATGQRQTVTELPGFARGLAFCGSLAFVGMSKIRETSVMDGVPLAERKKQLKCGVAVVDLISGKCIADLEFQSAVEEIFDVQLLLGLRFPEIIGFQKEAIHHTFIIPDATGASPA